MKKTLKSNRCLLDEEILWDFHKYLLKGKSQSKSLSYDLHKGHK